MASLGHNELPHIPQGYFTGTGAVIEHSYDCPSASEVTLKDRGYMDR